MSTGSTRPSPDLDPQKFAAAKRSSNLPNLAQVRTANALSIAMFGEDIQRFLPFGKIYSDEVTIHRVSAD